MEQTTSLSAIIGNYLIEKVEIGHHNFLKFHLKHRSCDQISFIFSTWIWPKLLDFKYETINNSLIISHNYESPELGKELVIIPDSLIFEFLRKFYEIFQKWLYYSFDFQIEFQSDKTGKHQVLVNFKPAVHISGQLVKLSGEGILNDKDNREAEINKLPLWMFEAKKNNSKQYPSSKLLLNKFSQSLNESLADFTKKAGY